MLGEQVNLLVNIIYQVNQRWNLYAEAGLLLYRELLTLIMVGRICQTANILDSINMDKYIVYKHITPSGKVYIGITKREKARDRWKYGHGYKQNRHFYNAILKYGWKNIKHQILASDLSLEEACTLEKELISLYTK
jgi:hypothetical protein